MADPYIGEIRMVGFSYAPRGWANADGQLVPVDQQPSLFALYGTTYGGDGRNNFALPDLRGRVPIHVGQGPGTDYHRMGQAGGYATIELHESQIPPHSHPAIVHAKAAGGTDASPEGHYWAQHSRDLMYCTDGNVQMAADAVEVLASTGGGEPVSVMQPFLTIRYCVCMTGLFPPRT